MFYSFFAAAGTAQRLPWGILFMPKKISLRKTKASACAIIFYSVWSKVSRVGECIFLYIQDDLTCSRRFTYALLGADSGFSGPNGFWHPFWHPNWHPGPSAWHTDHQSFRKIGITRAKRPQYIDYNSNNTQYVVLRIIITICNHAPKRKVPGSNPGKCAKPRKTQVFRGFSAFL